MLRYFSSLLMSALFHARERIGRLLDLFIDRSDIEALGEIVLFDGQGFAFETGQWADNAAHGAQAEKGGQDGEGQCDHKVDVTIGLDTTQVVALGQIDADNPRPVAVEEGREHGVVDLSFILETGEAWRFQIDTAIRPFGDIDGLKGRTRQTIIQLTDLSEPRLSRLEAIVVG